MKEWLAVARHPRFDRPYTKLAYRPMLELLEYLRAHGYKTYIVTGGGQDFIRVYAEQVYGVPPEQVVGTIGGIIYGYDASGKPILTRGHTLLLFTTIAGLTSICALVPTGQAYCWGESGLLGDGQSREGVNELRPVPVGGTIRFRSLDGASTFCGLSTDNRAHCWGSIGGSWG